MNNNLHSSFISSDLIDSFLKKWTEYYNNITFNTQDYRLTNKFAKELSVLEKKIHQDSLYPIFYDIVLIEKNPTLRGYLSKNIGIYENDIGKKILKKFYNEDLIQNFTAKYGIENWNENMIKLRQDNLKQIQDFQIWKNANPGEYKEFIKNLSKFV